MKKEIQERIVFIKANLSMTNIELSEVISISAGSIEKTMQRHGIKRGAEELKIVRSKNGKIANKILNEKYSFKKENNPNWKGGIAQNHYHYKKIQTQRYPDRVKARNKVHVAVKAGKLLRVPCHCGEAKVFAHHDDYSQPLKVQWLCRKHHRELHDNKH